MDDWIFGCDICQEVCPHNQDTERSRAASINDAYEAQRAELDLLAVLNWSEDDRRAAFRGSAMKRAKLSMMKRNALIAIGNHPSVRSDGRVRMRIESIAREATESSIVQDTARAVLERAAR